MRTLTITRGLPGSGKTTWAEKEIENSLTDTVRVNRDDIRMARHGVAHGLSAEQEVEVTAIAHASATGLLRGGFDVIVDDTNLNIQSVKGWQKVAHLAQAQFKCVDFHYTVDECIANVQQRVANGGRDVPADAIRRMHKRYLKGEDRYGFPVLPKFEKASKKRYRPVKGKPFAYIVDIDGTLTLGPHEREPFQWHKVGNDLPNEHVIDILNALWSSGWGKLIFVSGRSDACYDETQLWVKKHLPWFWDEEPLLYMRKDGDWRRDDLVKGEIFDQYVRYNYDVQGVFDDRNQVVNYWRSIGLTVFQVADGDF